ncbi:MAG: ABC transporter permease [Nannocystales bacterium]
MRGMLSNRKAAVGAVFAAFFVAMIVLGPFFAQDPAAFVAAPHQAPSAAHWLGTNGQGQDVLAQTLVGGRVTLTVAVFVGLSVTVVGALAGTTAAYFGGWVDDLLGLSFNVLLIIPGLPLAVVLSAYLPAGPMTIALVLIVTGWAWNARILRAQALSLRKRDFVQAAVVLGEPAWRIVLFELLPNMVPLFVSCFISATVYALGAQVGLEFLGLGDIGEVTWGTALYWATNDAALLIGSWWVFLPPGLCVAGVGFALVMLNFGIDEISNPVLKVERAWRKRLQGAEIVPGITPVLRAR